MLQGSFYFILLHLILKVLTRDKVGNIVVVRLLLALLLHVLVALSQLAERRKRVGS